METAVRTPKTKIRYKSLPVSFHFFIECATKTKPQAYLSIREKVGLKWKQFDFIYKKVNN
jgi:hypothetical protein